MNNPLGLLTAVFLVGLTTTATAMIRYVDLNSPNPTPPYTNWGTAATNIQDAVDAAAGGDEIVVTNGVYASGGRAVTGTMTNRVAIDKALLVRSVNGPLVTFITGQPSPVTTTNGDGAIRCVYVADNAELSGFTLTNGHTRTNGDSVSQQSGGGVWCSTYAVVINCILTGNSAKYGGGAHSGSLYNCDLTGNSATYYGGGARWNALNNCRLTGNSALLGGGAFESTLNWCTVTGNSARDYAGGAYMGTMNGSIVYYNTAPAWPNYNGNALYFSCTTPLSGLACIADEPLFIDTNGWSNLRLQSNSPCINAADNAGATTTDLDGNPRIAGGTVDMGAYEFQGSGLSEFSSWLWQHGLRVDGTADDADSDSDTMNNWQEWRCDTDPTNALSVLQMLSPASAESGVTVSWQSVGTRKYFLERATGLDPQPTFQILQSNIVGQVGTTSYADTNSTGNGPFLYRVGVQQ